MSAALAKRRKKSAAVTVSTSALSLSLLDLPDELLVRIFDFVAQRLSIADEEDGGSYPRLVTGYMLVCQRIYTLCRYRLFRDVDLPEDPEQMTAALARIVFRPDIAQQITRLAFHTTKNNPLEHSMLSLSPNVTELDLRAPALYPALSKSLTSLKHLHTLAIALPDGEYEGLDFIHYIDLQLDAPMVRHLTIELPGSGGHETLGLIVTGAERLETLEMRLEGQVDLDEATPWLSLRSLTIRGQSGITDVNEFVDSLEEACRSAKSDEQGPSTLPQRHLALDLPIAVSGASNREFDESNAIKLFELLGDEALGKLEELDLRFFYNPLRSLEGRVPSVRVLRLHNISLERNPYAGEDRNHNRLETLYRFLTIFTNLKRLELDPQNTGPCWPAAVGSSLLCAIRHPEFFALLHVLQSTTKITEVRLRPFRTKIELRWTREEGGQEWQCERYKFDEV
ncbi:hypothetical protein RTBOTA2_005608 [Rhodotorula toruloides]|nr:hypothetical protein RTBOTA2_005608 [Rhodotorula toruloides]